MAGDPRAGRGGNPFNTSQDYISLGQEDPRDSRGGSNREHYPSRREGREDRERDRGDRGDRRRRSRSPPHHPSHHHRRREHEADSYSTSRDYREREREDRYRDSRRDERAWDRDRGHAPRRDRGEYDDRRRGGRDGRDSDLFDDRRHSRRDRDGGDRAEGRGGGGGGGRRPRSATPPVKQREPTPDLTNVVSILDRPRRMTQWDIKPPGYENITAEQAKLSGMFPLPGAPRQQNQGGHGHSRGDQQADPSRLQAFMDKPNNAKTVTGLKTANARQSKRLFVRNLTSNVTTNALMDFFNLQLNGLNVVSGPDPCTNAMINHEKRLGLVELKSAEDATVALCLDGIAMEAGGQELKISRPQDYIVPPAEDDGDIDESQRLSQVREGPNKLSITNAPTLLVDEQIIELLESVGKLRAYISAKDNSSDQFRGFAFCEYHDPSHTDLAVATLNNMEFGGESIKVKRASTGIIQAAGLEDKGVSAMLLLAATEPTEVNTSRVIQLLNMVTPEELMDNLDYQEIREDVESECSKFGHVEEIKIPRPQTGSRQGPGIGKIFIKYADSESATQALKGLAGRKFADRTVVATVYSEEYFDVSAW